MKKLLIILIKILLLVSCGVFKRESHEQRKVTAVQASTITDSVKVQKVTHVELAKSDKTTKKDKGTVIIKEVYYSKPDGLGKQHKTSEKITEQHNDVIVSNDISEEIVQDLKLKVNELKTKNTQLEAELSEKKDTKSKTKTTTPIWLYVVFFILGCVAFYLIEKQIKKFNIISKIRELWKKVKI